MSKNSLERLDKEYARIVNEYLDRVRRREGVIGAILFGSVARGEALPFPQSDIDLIVISRGLPEDLFERSELVRKIEGGPLPVQSIWMTPEDFEGHLASKAGYVLDAIHDGIVLYDEEGFLERKIKETKEELRRKSVRRIDGAWVWPIERVGEHVEL